MPQLPLPFASAPVFSADNFVVSECNQNAFNTLTNLELWMANALYLCGEKASGKTHLSHIFSKLCNAEIISEITPEKITGNCVIEDIEKLTDEIYLFEKGITQGRRGEVYDKIHEPKPDAGETLNQTSIKLFHLFNHCKENNFRLLLTSSKEPKDLPFKLPDLVSRLRACQMVKIDAPDDAIIATIMRKQFIDKQLIVDDEVLNYLIPRIERSFSSIKSLVDKIDESALSERKNISIPFVKKILLATENPQLL